MPLISKVASLTGNALITLSALLCGGEAMPVAPVASTGLQASGVEQAAYLHRHYPGYYSRPARRFRYARRNSPNRYCRNQPSRCR